MQIKEIMKTLECFAPLTLQESYDNSGLQIGKPETFVKKALICLDVTLAIVDEAIEKNCDLIISHHPLLFSGLKKICGGSPVEKIVEKVILHQIAVYSAHTHLDNIINGVNKQLSDKIGIMNPKILKPTKGILRKLVTFCPITEVENVREVLFSAGAGKIGNYDSCSSNTISEGTFRANKQAHPYVGEIDKLHTEKEVRIETIYPFYHEKAILQSLLSAHPYEEVAYDIYSLENTFSEVGSGMIGDLAESMSLNDFMGLICQKLKAPMLRYAGSSEKNIKRVALCGGSGAFLIKDAIAQKADAFITSDIKYHDFGDYSEELILIDAGHFETEQFTKHLLSDILNENFPTFATQISEQDNNLVKYFIK